MPADHKWFTRMVVAGALVQELQALGVDFPKVEGKALKELQEAGKALEGGKIREPPLYQIPGIRRKRVARQ